ncbi:zinc protease [Catalinimonas alkaloidigena]|uniref:Zinc protease n=1 Tax=Catalinimonas alkaloidigena TaxID=1075417 RepID=A0A1G9PFE6_9BACT|nr:pitrilysin family protein [Catalinimonas alkaloidigena]SDL97572.1 zinc protease [Catalinimonas alkaloidigena]
MKNILYRGLLGVALLALPLVVRAQEVVELPNAQSNKVVVKLAFRNGSVTDPLGKEGLTNLTAEVWTNTGSDRYTKPEIDALLYPMAASYGAFTDKEMTTLTFEVHEDHLDQFYAIFQGVLLRPAFHEKDFSRVRSNLKNYVEQVIKASSDEDFSKLALEEKLYEGTPYQHPKYGTVQGLDAITLEDVKQHFRTQFTRHNVTIGIAGKYPASFLTKLKADLNRLSDVAPATVVVPRPEMPDGLHVELIPKPNNLGTAIFAGYPIDIDRSSDDWPAMLVVNSYLGEHRKSYSKLYQLIREKRSMNYGDYTYIEWYEAGGQHQLPLTGFPRSSNYFAIWIRPVQTAYSLTSQYDELSDLQVGHAPFALRMALYEIDRVKNEGLTQEEFDLTRQFLRSYLKLYIQTPERRLGFLLDSRFYGLQDYIAEMDEALANLTLEQVNAAAARYLQTENLDVVMITDEAEAAPLKTLLETQAPSPMSYANVVRESLPESVFELDKTVEAFPLRVDEVTVVPPADVFQQGREGTP